MTTLNCKGRLINISEPLVMGIINATSDSFYTQNKYAGLENIVELARQMLADGVNILDIGGLSTRPGAKSISTQEEIDRVVPVIDTIKKEFPDCFISVDTYKAKVAALAVAQGADIVNDISAGSLDSAMLTTVAALNVPYIAMHMQGTPQTMQQQPQYEDVVWEVLNICKDYLHKCRAAGIKDVIIDPGFGFGKTLAQNFTLLKGMHTFQILECPILIGISRKSMIYNLLNITPDEALIGTTAAHMLALEQGAKILRVHDVKAAKQCIDIFQYYKNI